GTLAADASWNNGKRFLTLKSCGTLNARDPQVPTLGSQGRLSCPGPLMGWLTTPVLKFALPPERTVPPWHCEHLAIGPKKASRPRCCWAVVAKRLRLNLSGSVPAGNSCASMKASMAANSAGVGSRKSAFSPLLLRVKVL